MCRQPGGPCGCSDVLMLRHCLYSSLSSVSYAIATVVTVGGKSTVHHDSDRNVQKWNSSEFSRGLSADLVDLEGFTVLFHEVSGILGVLLQCMTVPLDHYTKQFEAFNELSGVTGRVRPNRVRSLHCKCENRSFGAKLVVQDVSKQE